ncbi:ribosomal protection-like ABC-F family protein [Gordoniibacillus kamchatkensis]
MEQHLDSAVTDLPLLEFVYSSDPLRFELKRTMEKLQAELQPDPGATGYERYLAALDRYMEADGYVWEAEAERTLLQMKLGPELWHMPFETLSGGQKTRAQLARLLVRKPKLLVLDEPTNHLDSDTLLWLEQWLDAYPGTVLFVSHDRAFLDRIATSIYELSAKGGVKYPGGYTKYREQKELERREQEALYRKQQLAREALLESIRMYAEWYRQADRDAGKQSEVKITASYYKARATKHTSRLRAKEKELERLESEAVQKPRDAAQLKVRFETSEFRAQTLLRLEGVRFAWTADGKELLRGLTMAVERGDRLAVLGRNGAGKSTLLKLLIGQLQPTSGAFLRSPQTRIGYFSQELELLAPEETILDSLLAIPDMTQSTARTLLGCFMFGGDDAFRRIGSLSMGEKCRVAFLRLYFSGANLLVLDEPTNYLDVDTRERVEEALERYPGALVLVSHDRYLVRRLADRLLFLPGDGSSELFEGGLAEYEEAVNRRAALTGDPQLAGEIAALELQLARWMAESAGTEEENAALLNKIGQARRRLDELRAQLFG